MNVARSSSSSRPPSAPKSAHHRGHRPAARIEPRSRATRGASAAALPGRPPPVMWATPRRSWPAAPSAVAQVEDRRGVDPGRRQEDLAEGHQRLARGGAQGRARRRVRRGSATEALLVRLGEVEVVLGKQRPDEREAVGVEAARRQADDDVAGREPGAIDQPVALDDPGARAGEVELARVEQPGMLGRLAADERAARPRGSPRRPSRRARRRSPGSSRPTAT